MKMKINEFTAGKMGEVLAINQVGAETIKKGRETLISILGVERVMDIEEKNRIHGEELMRIATDEAVIDTVLSKAKKDSETLEKMRDIYIADHWDEPNEILEWLGFSEGASIVHFALLRGAAEALDHGGLLMLTEEAISWHYEVIEMAESELGTIGQDKSTG